MNLGEVTRELDVEPVTLPVAIPQPQTAPATPTPVEEPVPA